MGKDPTDEKRKKSSLTPLKLEALNKVGFMWAKRKGQASWDERYKELKVFRATFGNCDIPTKYKQNPALGRWVSTQRSQYKKMQEGKESSMTPDRIEKLEKLDFRWTMMNKE